MRCLLRAIPMLVVLLLVLCLGATSTPVYAAGVGEGILEDARRAQGMVDGVVTDHMKQLRELEAATAAAKVPLFKERGDHLKSIKGFWKQVFVNHPGHTVWLNEQDKDILEYMSDFRVEDIGEAASLGAINHYRVSLTFAKSNPYFSDLTIARVVKGIASGAESGGEGIKWKEGKKPNGPSFFNFFEKDPAGRTLMPHNYNDMGHVMRYEFWPNPFTYYDMPKYQKFIPENLDLGGAYQQELDRANEGGLPPSDEAVKAAMEAGHIPAHDTGATTPTKKDVGNTPVSSTPPAPPVKEEEVVQKNEEEVKEEKKVEAKTVEKEEKVPKKEETKKANEEESKKEQQAPPADEKKTTSSKKKKSSSSKKNKKEERKTKKEELATDDDF